jgi:hypothetical protein
MGSSTDLNETHISMCTQRFIQFGRFDTQKNILVFKYLSMNFIYNLHLFLSESVLNAPPTPLS